MTPRGLIAIAVWPFMALFLAVDWLGEAIFGGAEVPVVDPFEDE